MPIATKSLGKSLDEMLEQLNNDGVSLTIFSPKWFGEYSTKYHVEAKKSDNGVKVEINENEQETLREAIAIIYDKWHTMLEGKIRQFVGAPAIEHKPMSAAEAQKADEDRRYGGEQVPKSQVNLDDEIPF